MFLKTSLVTEVEFHKAHAELGSIYFVLDKEADAIKVGFSRDPISRLSSLQVGSSRELKLIGLVAAPPEVEAIVHYQLHEGWIRGEWFWDRGITTQWLMDMTQNEPLYRNVWRLVEGQQVYRAWHKDTQTHTRHVWDPVLSCWDPPLAK